MTIALNDKLKTAAYTKEFKAKGRVRVPGVLSAEGADALYAAIRDNCVWNIRYRKDGESTTLSGQELQSRIQRRQRELMERIYTGAQNGYQHLYFVCPLSSPLPDGSDPLAEAKAFFDSDEFLEVLRKVTGVKKGALLDVLARWTNRDHFETDNAEALDGQDKKFVFTLDLAPNWRGDWGGHLNFLDDDGAEEERWAPGYNSLDIYTVPARTSISYVTPFVGEFRLAVCGEMI